MSEGIITVDPDDESEMARDLRLDREGRIATLKSQLKSAVDGYRIVKSDAYPVGPDLEAYLRPTLAAKATLCNEIARRLAELDPTMPTWIPLPEGTHDR